MRIWHGRYEWDLEDLDLLKRYLSETEYHQLMVTGNVEVTGRTGRKYQITRFGELSRYLSFNHNNLPFPMNGYYGVCIRFALPSGDPLPVADRIVGYKLLLEADDRAIARVKGWDWKDEKAPGEWLDILRKRFRKAKRG